MNDKPDAQLFREVQEALGLPSPSLVEKDWHVVQALAAIHHVTTDGLSLVFGGGTALGRGFGLLERMSEDIDLRIVGAAAPSRGALGRLRGLVTERLETAGFAVEGNVKVMQNGKYVRYDLPYSAEMAGTGVLRPEIKIELGHFPIHRAPVRRPVQSFVAEALKDSPEIPEIDCVAVSDTVADKFVALTRRGGAMISGIDEFDPTLVRHIYDTARSEAEIDLDDVVEIARTVMAQDAAERAENYPAYAANPLAETSRVIEVMATEKRFIESYDRHMLEMVYGERPAYEAAFQAVRRIAERLTTVKA